MLILILGIIITNIWIVYQQQYEEISMRFWKKILFRRSRTGSGSPPSASDPDPDYTEQLKLYNRPCFNMNKYKYKYNFFNFNFNINNLLKIQVIILIQIHRGGGYRVKFFLLLSINITFFQVRSRKSLILLRLNSHSLE